MIITAWNDGEESFCFSLTGAAIGRSWEEFGRTSLVPGVPEGPPRSGVPREIEPRHPQRGLRFTKWSASDCLVFTGVQTAPRRYSLLGVASQWANILI